MRLIDADALEVCFDFEIINTDTDYAVGVRDATRFDWSVIKAAPTIEAIPIEWLQQFVYTKPDVIEHIIVLWRREQEQGDD